MWFKEESIECKLTVYSRVRTKFRIWGNQQSVFGQESRRKMFRWKMIKEVGMMIHFCVLLRFHEDCEKWQYEKSGKGKEKKSLPRIFCFVSSPYPGLSCIHDDHEKDEDIGW